MKVPQSGIFFNKEKLCRKIYLYEIEALIREKLSSENLKMLSEELDLMDLLFMRYGNNRFATGLPKEKVLESVVECIDAYEFLLNSNLELKRIRHALGKTGWM